MADETKVEGIDASTANILMGRSPEPTAQPISTGEPATPTDGKADSTAPVDGQPAVVKPGEPAKQQQPSKEQIAADVKKAEDDLKSALGFAENPEQERARKDREHAASSKEARRVTEYNKKLAEILKAQGLDPVDEDGMPIGLAPNKAYSKNVPDFNIEFKNLSEAEQELFTEDPSKAIKMVLDRAKQAFVRATPTLDHAPTQVSPERETEAVNFLSKEKWTDGSLKHGDLADNAGLIQQAMMVPNASKALREFAASEPEMVREYLNLKIRATRQFLKDSAQKLNEQKLKKEKEAQQTPPFGPAGGGSPVIGAASDDIGAAIAGAGKWR